MHTQKYTHLHTNGHTQTHTHKHTHKHLHIHTHTHTHTLVRGRFTDDVMFHRHRSDEYNSSRKNKRPHTDEGVIIIGRSYWQIQYLQIIRYWQIHLICI